MTHRNEVFQAKVLRKLYPPPQPPELETDPSPPCNVEALSKKAHVKRKAPQTGDAGTAKPGRRMYTVLPPPSDYPQQSVTPPQLEDIKSAKDPAEEEVDECSEDLDQDEEGKTQKRRRRRKKKMSLTADGDSGKGGADPKTESGHSGSPAGERGERLSTNKKRKLKKKRHKEKLLALGLVPRAAALEFTYQKDNGQKDEQVDNDKRAVEVVDFLKTTMEIYLSDSSSSTDRPPRLSGTLDDLLSGIAGGSRPASLVEQLYTLKELVQQKGTTEALSKSLEDIRADPPMTAEETTAVVSLFQYWITEILPMQRDRETGLSAIHP